MNILAMMGFEKFLEMKFLEWQQQEGGRKTVREFAEYLGFKQSTVSTWWSGKYPPNEESVEKLAGKLGPEVYDVLGLERPDPRLVYIQRIWEMLPHETHRALAEMAEQALKDTEGDRHAEEQLSFKSANHPKELVKNER